MEKKQSGKVLCRSVFRDGTDTTTTERFTQKWIAMINQLESSRRFTAGDRA